MTCMFCYFNDLDDEPIASDLSEDRRTMSAKLLGDDRNTPPSRAPAGNLPCIHVDVGVGAFYCSFVASDNYWHAWQAALHP